MPFDEKNVYHCDGGCGRIIKTPSPRLLLNSRKRFTCLSERCKRKCKLKNQCGSKSYRRRGRYFRCISCNKKFYRAQSEIVRGKVYFCTWKCRYPGSIRNDNPVTVQCTVCGKSFHRPRSQADAQTPFCSQFCLRIYQRKHQADSQAIYSGELLRAMEMHEGSGCAFPGCESLQYHHNHPMFKNQFHVCKLHKDRIKGALKERRRNRSNILKSGNL